MELLNDVQKRVTFGKDSFRTFSLYDQCYNTQGESFPLSEENDPTQIVQKSLDQAVMVDKTLYISGQLGMGKDGNIVGGGTLAQVYEGFWLRQELKESQCPSVAALSCLEHSILHRSLSGLT